MEQICNEFLNNLKINHFLFTCNIIKFLKTVNKNDWCQQNNIRKKTNNVNFWRKKRLKTYVVVGLQDDSAT